MKLELLAVRDAKTEAFMQPFFAQSVGAATREFGDIARDRSHPVGKHPEDYALFWFGSFNALTAEFDLKAQPVQVVLAINLVEGEGALQLTR